MSTRSGWVALLLLVACGGGQWGYAREYETYGAEDDHLEGTAEVTYEDVRRDPEGYAASRIAWFGMVEKLDGDRLELNFRTLSPRNLCDDESASSCRVTVSDRSGGPFTVKVQLDPAHTSGQDRVWQGTLMRIVGSPTGELDPETGGPVIQAEWYRHWPHGRYVTTGARGSMRR